MPKDKQELELPIEVFGKKCVLGMLNKSHPVKEAAVDEIKKEVLDYNPDDSIHLDDIRFLIFENRHS